MHRELSGVLDVTINYQTNKLSFLNIVCGNVDKISVHYRLLPITEDILGNYYEDREFRKNFQRWLNSVWAEKDSLLDTFIHDS